MTTWRRVYKLSRLDDTIAPTLLCPTAPALAQCDVSEVAVFMTLDEFGMGGGSASDNCGIDSSTFILLSEVSDGETCPETVTRTYSVADSCGNTSTCGQTIIIDDTIAPMLTCPGDTTAVCDASEVVAYATYEEFVSDGGNATDNCGIDETTFTLLSEVSDGETCPETVTRTYSIADSCGNTGTCQQIITVNDTIPPTLTCPAEVIVECLSDIPAGFTSYAAFAAAGGSSSDNCEIDTSTFLLVQERPSASSCPDTLFRVYVVSDLCGNGVSCAQILIYDDTTPPMLTCPGDTTAVCDASEVVPYATYADFTAAGGNATDNCGIVETTFHTSE